MGHYKNYIIMVMVYLFILSSISVVALATNNPAETQIDIEESVVTEPITEPVIEETEPETEPVAEATEPPTEPTITYADVLEEIKETVADVAEDYEPVVKETEPAPKPTEPPEEKETEPVVEETEPAAESTVNQDELEMLACVIYQEAGGDAYCDDCRYRVADVVLNRVADPRFPNTMYKVLTAKAQYGRFHWTGIVWPSRASNSGEAHAVARAYAVAEDVLNGNHSELYGEGYIWQAEFVQGKDNIYCCGHYFGR